MDHGPVISRPVSSGLTTPHCRFFFLRRPRRLGCGKDECFAKATTVEVNREPPPYFSHSVGRRGSLQAKASPGHRLTSAPPLPDDKRQAHRRARAKILRSAPAPAASDQVAPPRAKHPTTFNQRSSEQPSEHNHSDRHWWKGSHWEEKSRNLHVRSCNHEPRSVNLLFSAPLFRPLVPGAWVAAHVERHWSASAASAASLRARLSERQWVLYLWFQLVERALHYTHALSARLVFGTRLGSDRVTAGWPSSFSFAHPQTAVNVAQLLCFRPTSCLTSAVLE